MANIVLYTDTHTLTYNFKCSKCEKITQKKESKTQLKTIFNNSLGEDAISRCRCCYCFCVCAGLSFCQRAQCTQLLLAFFHSFVYSSMLIYGVRCVGRSQTQYSLCALCSCCLVQHYQRGSRLLSYTRTALHNEFSVSIELHLCAASTATTEKRTSS